MGGGYDAIRVEVAEDVDPGAGVDRVGVDIEAESAVSGDVRGGCGIPHALAPAVAGADGGRGTGAVGHAAIP